MPKNTVEVDRDALEEIAGYAADDIRNHMGPEMEELEDAVRAAYDALENE